MIWNSTLELRSTAIAFLIFSNYPTQGSPYRRFYAFSPKLRFLPPLGMNTISTPRTPYKIRIVDCQTPNLHQSIPPSKHFNTTIKPNYEIASSRPKGPVVHPLRPKVPFITNNKHQLISIRGHFTAPSAIALIAQLFLRPIARKP